MTRRPVALAVVAALAAVIGLDLAASAPLNPYKAPPFLALGSGLAASGAHCTAAPAK
ncbi:hypothetical protein CCR83_11380 [Rhodobacter veldkampii DSM 11550]|uniref:hypothetical protein n=1 Tax=Phaeovulum veldkampii TaxID=33049 RepID=UPI0010E16A69|nr:hypothetical protein [Phaeovulum veldkampii]MBK5947026.1 hypothetical protein [Phaeovulum veldkampii DSM 11550]TDQ57273.1 hypothetical protein EV658_11350 [Phaeovulum veldkampii DSM 11550]